MDMRIRKCNRLSHARFFRLMEWLRENTPIAGRPGRSGIAALVSRALGIRVTECNLSAALMVLLSSGELRVRPRDAWRAGLALSLN